MPFFVHPGAIILQRYAERTLGPTRSAWVRRHLASCVDCRASVVFTRSLGSALAGLPEPSLRDDTLIDRIVTERGAGARALLPTSDVVVKSPARRAASLRVAVGVAVVLLVVLFKGFFKGSESLKTAESEEFAVSEFFLPKPAFATEVVREESSFPPLSVDGTRLRAGRVAYGRFEQIAGVRRQVGSESVSLSPDQIDGRAVWRVLQQRQLADTEHVETSYVDRASLEPLSRTIRVRPYTHYAGITVSQRLAHDSLTGSMQIDRGIHRPIARRLPPQLGPYLSDAISPVLLGATTLGPSWRGRLAVLGWAVRDGDVSFPVRLRIVGEERVTVPAGTFACWKVNVDASIGMQSFWVRKSDGVGVRAVLTRADTTREIVLIP